ncbi:hypothetical protein [Novosphingobium sp.]|nr:hypothetical protein [Novosphingobium sp.]
MAVLINLMEMALSGEQARSSQPAEMHVYKENRRYLECWIKQKTFYQRIY